jgi:putative ABC transport system permease protein
MLKNYIKVALRNIKKHRVYSIINIIGLAIGMAVCILILLFIQDELSYDTFHQNANRIYRIAQVEEQNNEQVPIVCIGGGVTIKCKNDFPEAIEKATRLWFVTSRRETWTIIGDKRYKEKKIFAADTDFFDVFSFKFLKGNRNTAVKNPNSVVITEEIAKKYFGNKEALGNIIKVDFFGTPDLKVTGVLENIPGNSHMHFDMLVSLSTFVNERNQAFFETMFSNQFYSYILLKENYQVGNLEKRLPEFREKHLTDEQKKRVHKFFLQPLKDIHLYAPDDPYTEIEPENTGSITSLYIFAIIGILTLAIACINFMNLATARYANRAKEVGLRKVIGSGRNQLLGLFIGESITITFIALPFAIFFASIGLPLFNFLSGKSIALDFLHNPYLLIGLPGIVLFTGFFSGSYPAFFLSAFNPIDVIKGKISAGSKSSTLRKSLVIGQFIVSISLVACAVVIWQQLDFMRNKDLGFSRKNIIEIPVILPLPERTNIMEYLKNEYLKYPGVLNACVSSSVPGDIRGIARARIEGAPEDQYHLVTQVPIGFDFIKTLGIEIIEGRDFNRENTSDLQGAVIINEATKRTLGLEDPVVGKRIMIGDNYRTIIGIFKDIHWEPKRREIFGMMFVVIPNANRKLVVKLDETNISNTLVDMKNLWDKTITTRTFEYKFLGENIDNLYKPEKRLSEIVKSFTVLAIIIACLGLIGLASFTAQQRTKEIGIRKVLGASVSEVVLLLSKEYSKLMIIAIVFSVPIVIYIMNQWLAPEHFFYRISIGIIPFIFAAVLVFMVAFFSIISQSIKASLANPIDALKYE